MSPYYCYTHEGLYEAGDVDGCHHETCVAFRAKDVPPLGIVAGVVPGGSKDTKAYRFHADFDKGLDKYREARMNGLQPKATTARAVDDAEAQAASQRRALKKLGGAGEGLKTVPGVEK
jgi:hypothetical protein